MGENFSLKLVTVCEASSFVLNEEIVVVDDCYYFKTYNPGAPFSPNLVDRTGNEFYFNKLFIDDLIKRELLPKERFWCGLSVAKDLSHKLQHLYKEGFLVILAFDYEHCYVRFFKIRKGESILEDDLEKYKHEAVLVIFI